MGYINGKGYSGNFGAYNKLQYGAGSPKFAGLRGYTGYPQGYADYDQENAAELTTRQVANIAERNYEVKPAGLQGLDIEDAARLAQRDYKQSPAGSGSTLAGLSVSQAAKLAEKGSLLGSLEDPSGSAFDGLGDSDSKNGWGVYFNSATSALTETGVTSALAAAVKSVPDSTPAEIKQQYYMLAMEMLRKRKATNLRHVDIKRVELESNLGWLINPSLPKSGGFDKAIDQAMGTIGAELAKNEKDYRKMQRLEAFGRELKQSIKKFNQFEGLGDLLENKHLLIGGLAIVGILVWCLKGKKKLSFKRR